MSESISEPIDLRLKINSAKKEVICLGAELIADMRECSLLTSSPLFAHSMELFTFHLVQFQNT